jgi:hypothetical protein
MSGRPNKRRREGLDKRRDEILADAEVFTAAYVAGQPDSEAQLGDMNVNTQGSKGRTALMVVSEVGDIKAVAALLNAGADLTLGDDFKSNVVHLAARAGDLEAVKALLANNENPDDIFKAVNGVNGFNLAPLYEAAAAYGGDDAKAAAIVELLLRVKADPDRLNGPCNSSTALMRAAETCSSVAVAEALIKGGATVNKTDEFGYAARDQVRHNVWIGDKRDALLELLEGSPKADSVECEDDKALDCEALFPPTLFEIEVEQ